MLIWSVSFVPMDEGKGMTLSQRLSWIGSSEQLRGIQRPLVWIEGGSGGTHSTFVKADEVNVSVALFKQSSFVWITICKYCQFPAIRGTIHKEVNSKIGHKKKLIQLDEEESWVRYKHSLWWKRLAFGVERTHSTIGFSDFDGENTHFIEPLVIVTQFTW